MRCLAADAALFSAGAVRYDGKQGEHPIRRRKDAPHEQQRRPNRDVQVGQGVTVNAAGSPQCPDTRLLLHAANAEAWGSAQPLAGLDVPDAHNVLVLPQCGEAVS